MRLKSFITLLLVAPAVAKLIQDNEYLQISVGMSTVTNASPVSVSPESYSSTKPEPSAEILELRQAPAVAPGLAAPAVAPGIAPQPAPGNPAVPAPGPANPAGPVVDPKASTPIPPQALGIPPFDNADLPAAPAPNVPAAGAPPNNPLAPAPLPPPPPPPPANSFNPVSSTVIVSSTVTVSSTVIVSSTVTVSPSVTTTSALLSSPDISNDFVTVQWVETWIGGTSQTWVPKTITFDFQPFVTQAPLPGKGQVGMGTLTGVPGKTKTVNAGVAPTPDSVLMKGLVAALGVGIAGAIV